MKRLNKDVVEDIVRLSPAQESLLFYYIRDPSDSIYFEQTTILLKGAMSPQRFVEALNEVVAGNPALRSIFRWRGLSKPHQVILKPRMAYVGFADLRGSTDPEADVRKLAENERLKTFQLDRLPPFWVLLCQVSDSEHYAIFNFHHLIMDGWSFAVMVKELMLSLSHSDHHDKGAKTSIQAYAAWLSNLPVKQIEAYWTGYLEAFAEIPRFPFEKLATEETESNLVKVQRTLSPQTLRHLKDKAANLNVTVASCFNALWSLILHKYCQVDVVIHGTTYSGRPDSLQGMDSVVGMFISTLPILLKINECSTLADLVRQTHQDMLEHRRHETVGVAALKRLAGLAGDAPLFNSIVVVENYPIDESLSRAAGQGIVPSLFDTFEQNNFNLTVAIHELPEFTVSFEFAASAFEEASIQSLADQYLDLILSFPAHVNLGIQAISVLTAKEKTTIIDQFNHTEAEFRANEFVHDWICEQSRVRGHEPAVVFNGEVLSYSELERKSRAISQRIRSSVPQDQRVVPVLVDWSIDVVVAFLGILRSGLAYLPIDPRYPAERVQKILKNCGAKVALSDEASRLAEVGAMECITVSACYTEPGADEPAPIRLNPSDQAYVIYTSGSTGDPKGIAISHAAFTDFVDWAIDAYDHQPGYRTLLTNSFAFDSSILMIFPALASGGVLHILDPKVRMNAKAYVGYLKTHAINFIDEIPVIMNVILDELKLSGAKNQLPDLKLISLGSDFVPAKTMRECLVFVNRDAHISNGYGPAEASVIASTYRFLGKRNEKSLIGKPRRNLKIYILDQNQRIVPIGVPGEIAISGIGLAIGYVAQPELTARKFIPNPYASAPYDRLYLTGDMGFWHPDGNIEYLGRRDTQVKIRGYRIELEEIENAIMDYEQIEHAAVATFDNGSAQQRLVAYVVPRPQFRRDAMREFLRKSLPAYMVPDDIITLKQMPLGPNSKVDRKQLIDPRKLRTDSARSALPAASAAANPHTLRRLQTIWGELLGLQEVDIDAKFFEIGGNSIQIIHLLSRLQHEFPHVHWSVDELFSKSSIRQQIGMIDGIQEQSQHSASESRPAQYSGGVAVIGIGVRLPGVQTLGQYFDLLEQGRTAIREIPADRQSLDPTWHNGKEYLKAGYLDGIDGFDPGAFGISHRDARLIDPHQRLLLEVCDEAIHNAGHKRSDFRGMKVGVFIAGIIPSYYQYLDAGLDEILATSIPALLAGRIAYHFDFQGPAWVVDTACSSSLVALHQAKAALQNGECEAAIVGGAYMDIAPIEKALCMSSGIVSKTEMVRAFDNDSDGTIAGEGVICMVLKREDDAIQNRDPILGILRGSAVMQDGGRSNGITAPSSDAQAETLRRAWAEAGVQAQQIGYMEAHGTGTKIGDPLEVRGITQATQGFPVAAGSIPIGSVKTNLGHTDCVAGLAGSVKVLLSLKYRHIFPSLNYKVANEFIDFASAPVFVETRSRRWDHHHPWRRHATVSSFGLSGTNVHAVFEEGPEESPAPTKRAWHLLPLSARSPESLGRQGTLLAEAGRHFEDRNLADIAHTLQTAREEFEYRQVQVVSQLSELMDRTPRATKAQKKPRCVFMFPGQGSQFVRMGTSLYENEPVFQKHLDECFAILAGVGRPELKPLLWDASETAPIRIANTENTQLLLFCVEFALAKLVMSWGVEPALMVGHSVGEYVAACLSGVLTLTEALTVLDVRARLMARTEPAAMLSVRAASAAITSFIGRDLDLAADNSSTACVVSGTKNALQELQSRLQASGIDSSWLRVSHAYHSRLMEPILEEFAAALGQIPARAPTMPYLSNLTGELMTDAVLPSIYWVDHLREPVQFRKAVELILAAPDLVPLELGPGKGLSHLIISHSSFVPDRPVLKGLTSSYGNHESKWLMESIGGLWEQGFLLDWSAAYPAEERRRVHLPYAPFANKPFWFQRKEGAGPTPNTTTQTASINLDGFLHTLRWKPFEVTGREPRALHVLAIFSGDAEYQQLRANITADAVPITAAICGDAWAAQETIRFNPRQDVSRLLRHAADLAAERELLILDFSRFFTPARPEDERAVMDDLGFHLALLQTLNDLGKAEARVLLLAQELFPVAPLEGPATGSILGLALGRAANHGGNPCWTLDLGRDFFVRETEPLKILCHTEWPFREMAYRQGQWHAQQFESLHPSKEAWTSAVWRPGGVYVLTGGLGGIALELMQYASRKVPAHFHLISRRGMSGHTADSGLTELERIIAEVKARHCTVTIHEADISQRRSLDEALTAIRRTHGRIDGVLHCAGVLAKHQPFSSLRPEDFLSCFHAKVFGTMHLLDLLTRDILDFVLLFSSVDAILGLPDAAPYSTANAFLDACAVQQRLAGRNVLSIHWGQWQGTGMGRKNESIESLAAAHKDIDLSPLNLGFSPEIGAAVIDFAFHMKAPGLFVSQLSSADCAMLGKIPAFRMAADVQTIDRRDHATQPPPATLEETVRIVKAIWESQLETPDIDIEQSFFSLGGDSIAGLSIILELSKRFNTTIKLHDLLENNTIRALATILYTAQAEDKPKPSGIRKAKPIT